MVLILYLLTYFHGNFPPQRPESCLSAGLHCGEPQHSNGKGDKGRVVKASSVCEQVTGNNSYPLILLLAASVLFLKFTFQCYS